MLLFFLIDSHQNLQIPQLRKSLEAPFDHIIRIHTLIHRLPCSDRALKALTARWMR